jgi:hypothetical protein
MRLILNLALVSTVATAGFAQAPAAPAGGDAATQPANQPMSARVIQLAGKASYAPATAGGEAGAWKPVKLNDVLPAGSRIRTQVRARVVLAFGDDTVVVIERATLASIDQFHRSADTKRVKLGLGHGTVRAGVAETTLRSDMTIETPTATLSKRGTMDFGISYEPSTGRFRVYLNREGLIEALNKTTGQSQLVRPGQYVTQTMQAWINTLTHDRWVPVVDTYGLTDAETVFNEINESGMAVVEPGEGAYVYGIGGRDLAGALAQSRGPTINFTPLLSPIRPGPGPIGPIPRPEGNFGTGSGAFSLQLKRAR